MSSVDRQSVAVLSGLVCDAVVGSCLHNHFVVVGSVRHHELSVDGQLSSVWGAERAPLHQHDEEDERLQSAELRARTPSASRPEAHELFHDFTIHLTAVRLQKALRSKRGRISPDVRIPAGGVEVDEDGRTGGNAGSSDDHVGEGRMRD